MTPSTWRRRCLLGAAILVYASSGLPRPAVAADASREVSRGCPPERAQDGEVRLVFLGDSGYGQGFSEWGTQGQDAIAARLARLSLPPDLVFFLGDNIYWRGSADLYKSRFDDVYEPLIRDCKAHVALGNHDLKGCRAVEEYERWESCLQELRTSLEADRKARYMRQGLAEPEAAAKAKAETAAESGGELAAEAIRTRKVNCLPGDATAYEEALTDKKTCNAQAALSHAQFGFGSIEKGEPPAHLRQRYYSILWPLPKLTRAGEVAAEGAAPTRPLVDVMVLDSNTLDVEGGMLGERDGRRREDELQLLWLRNAMSQWLPAPGETHRIWKFVVMHHPPYTPRSCACRIFGKCLGGHGDEPRLREQLQKTFEDLEPPDLVVAAHNHIYARSHPLDPSGQPVTTGKGGVRNFVTGGGGAPLYAIKGDDPRFAKALTMYHFVYLRLTATSAFYWTIDAGGRARDSGCFEKGSNVDHPLSPSFNYDDALPPRCAAEGG
ncbi:MAG TPA: metallophosphoesterase [Vicinamibacteria bacterium]